MNEDIRKAVRLVKFDRDKLTKYASSVDVGKGAVEKDFLISTFLLLLAYDKQFLPFVEKVVFRGGSCIKKAYYPNEARFSEDLDFTSLTSAETRGFLAVLKDLSGDDLGVTAVNQVTVNYENSGGMNIELGYTSVLGQPNHITFDLGTSKTLMKPEERKIEVRPYFESLEPVIRVMDIREVLVEKTRALLQRTRPRDAFDVWFLTKKKGMTIDRKMLEHKLRRNYEAAPKNKKDAAAFYSQNMIIRRINEMTDGTWRGELGGMLHRDYPSREEILNHVSEIVNGIGDIDLRSNKLYA